MPFSGDVVKYVIGGACGSDTWSVGFYQQLTGLSGVPTPTQMNAAALFRLNGFNTIVWNPASNALKVPNASGVLLSTCRSYLYQGGVLTAQGAGAISSVAGTAGSPTPFYVALCCSLLTNTPGRSGRGRVYLPLTGSGFSGTTGQITNAFAPWVANLATMLSGFGPDDTQFPGDPASHAVILSNKTAAVHPITSVRADSIPDTQHGRTRRITATSTASSAVT